MTEIDLSQTDTHPLENSGPQTSNELGGHPKVRVRDAFDLLRFNPLSNFLVVWHTSDHDPTVVVRKWLTANRDRLEAHDKSAREICANLTTPYDDAWDTVKDDFEWITRHDAGGNQAPQRETSCPKCDADDVKNLPRHLRACDGETDE